MSGVVSVTGGADPCRCDARHNKDKCSLVRWLGLVTNEHGSEAGAILRGELAQLGSEHFQAGCVQRCAGICAALVREVWILPGFLRFVRVPLGVLSRFAAKSYNKLEAA